MRRSTNKNTVCIEGAPIRTQYKSAGRRKKLRTWQNLFNCACTSKMALHFQQMGEGGGAGAGGLGAGRAGAAARAALRPPPACARSSPCSAQPSLALGRLSKCVALSVGAAWRLIKLIAQLSMAGWRLCAYSGSVGSCSAHASACSCCLRKRRPHPGGGRWSLQQRGATHEQNTNARASSCRRP